ncbi:rCG63205 [Rattus norvegicus]|uniref:RCG63205 n=1 Tax=Rattus norvegicus TaxID=10116 RepID=A6IBB5_RAT|nr:rCG63205 [Rattus norvegicus]
MWVTGYGNWPDNSSQLRTPKRQRPAQPPQETPGLHVTQALHCASTSHTLPTWLPESLPLTDGIAHAQRQKAASPKSHSL